MLQNAYFLAKIGADTAENEQHFAEFLPKTGNYPTGVPPPPPLRARGALPLALGLALELADALVHAPAPPPPCPFGGSATPGTGLEG